MVRELKEKKRMIKEFLRRFDNFEILFQTKDDERLFAEAFLNNAKIIDNEKNGNVVSFEKTVELEGRFFRFSWDVKASKIQNLKAIEVEKAKGVEIEKIKTINAVRLYSNDEIIEKIKNRISQLKEKMKKLLFLDDIVGTFLITTEISCLEIAVEIFNNKKEVSGWDYDEMKDFFVSIENSSDLMLSGLEELWNYIIDSYLVSKKRDV